MRSADRLAVQHNIGMFEGHHGGGRDDWPERGNIPTLLPHSHQHRHHLHQPQFVAAGAQQQQSAYQRCAERGGPQAVPGHRQSEGDQER